MTKSGGMKMGLAKGGSAKMSDKMGMKSGGVKPSSMPTKMTRREDGMMGKPMCGKKQ